MRWEDVLQLPDGAYAGGKRIPKTMLTAQASLTKNEQKLLERLRRLEHIATATKSSTRILPCVTEDRDIQSVLFLRCEMAQECGFAELASLLHKSFPHPIVLLFEEPGGKVGISASTKRKSLAEKGVVVVDRIESTKFFDPMLESYSEYLADLRYEALPQGDLLAFATAVCDRTAKADAVGVIGQYPKCPDAETPRLMALLGSVRDTQAEINALKLRHRDKGTSLAESSRIRMSLKKKECERDAFAAEIRELCHG